MTTQADLWRTGNFGDPRRSLHAHFVPLTTQERIAADEAARAAEYERDEARLARRQYLRQARLSAELTACPTCGRPCEFLAGYTADDDYLICTNCNWDSNVPENWHDGCQY